MALTSPHEPDADCRLCPRLAKFIDTWREKEPDWHNGPVRSFGAPDAELLIVGLAPGVRGANRTGRPFTGDYAGDLLYATLTSFGFAEGKFEARPDDSLRLTRAAITNAVRCVPPDNKPTGEEIRTCRQFLISTMAHFEKASAILALGRIAHESILRAASIRLKDAPFSHGAVHELGSGRKLYDSYHCSRYNTNTRRLTPEMFESVFERIQADLQSG
jgi:uracil-DNA glycosylase family 4